MIFACVQRRSVFRVLRQELICRMLARFYALSKCAQLMVCVSSNAVILCPICSPFLQADDFAAATAAAAIGAEGSAQVEPALFFTISAAAALACFSAAHSDAHPPVAQLQPLSLISATCLRRSVLCAQLTFSSTAVCHCVPKLSSFPPGNRPPANCR